MRKTYIYPLLGVLFLSGCAAINPQLGSGSSVVSGSGGDQQQAKKEGDIIAKCTRPIATVTLVENANPTLAQNGLSSPIPVLKLLMAQSHCFRVIDRGQAAALSAYERNLHNDEYEDVGASRVKADYVMTAHVLSSNSDSGGAGLEVAGMGIGSLFGGGLNSKSQTANVLLYLTDTNTDVQTYVAEGSAKKTDLSAGLTYKFFADQSILSAYQNTAMGKIIIAALLDAHNNLVKQLQ